MEKKDKKIPLEIIKKLPPKLLLRMINCAKEYLKHNEVMQKICNDYNVDINDIDYIPTTFSDLDVSAKTDHGIIYLNYKLLCDGNFFKDYGYLIHEYTHHWQQTTGNGPTKGADDGEYLENKFEQEGFQNQLEYMANEFGIDEAEDYVENLLKHHEIESKKDKKELTEVLLSNV